MRRHLASAAIAAGLLLVFAGPVAAWDAVGITITDSAGGGTIRGVGAPVVPELLMSEVLPGRPAGDLGPRFGVTYSWGFAGSALALQDLYPYAPGGPVTFTASPGQIASHAFAAGWRQSDAAMFQVLVAWGLPAQPGSVPAAEAPRAAAPAADGGTSSISSAQADRLRILVGSLALLGLAVLVIVGARSRTTGRQRA